MSRIGNMPISIAQDATVTVAGERVVIRGPKGECTRVIPEGIAVSVVDGILQLSVSDTAPATGDLHAKFGTTRAQLANDMHGVTKGWTKTLELSGVGYRAALSGASIVLSLGFSHQVTVVPPQGVVFTIQDGKIIISGKDKDIVGQITADIRSVKKPEPYKGKGIKYQGEYIRKKAGKAAKAIGGAPGAK